VRKGLTCSCFVRVASVALAIALSLAAATALGAPWSSAARIDHGPSAAQVLAAETRASATSFVAGFSADRPARVAAAAALGITHDILYDGPPRARSPLAKALARAHMTVIDARLSGALAYWECHRTHTVAPPPPGETNWYCASDEQPSADSPAAVLSLVQGWLREDAANPLVRGYWVLDDWPQWDGGSGRALLVEIRRAIERATPSYPAICGFGGAILEAGQRGGFEEATAANYSNEGCSMVGLYNYANTTSRASSGEGLDWSMSVLLREESEDLAKRGWVVANTPMLGISQGWSGRLGREYTPGLTPAEMVAEAHAFCSHGASSIAWYAWHDSGFRRSTMTPNNSAAIRQGIEQGISACALHAAL
jgi:hypothetical protein